MRRLINTWKRLKNDRRTAYEIECLKTLTMKQDLTVNRMFDAMTKAVSETNLYNATFNWCVNKTSRHIVINTIRLDGVGQTLTAEIPADLDPYSDTYNPNKVQLISLTIDVSNIGKELSIIYHLENKDDEWPLIEIERCERMLSTMIYIYKIHA